MRMARQKPWFGVAVIACIVLGVSVGAQAQSPTAASLAAEDEGLTFYESLQGSSNTLGQVYKLDSTIGYNFNQHFGVDAGLPIYFVQASGSTSSSLTAGSGSTSRNGIGNAYADLRLTLLNPVVNLVSNLDGTVPTGSSSAGFSTGRATFDWNNHLDRGFSRLTPFANLGVANTISDTIFFIRPFTTLGLVGHFEGGTALRLLPMVKVGGSLYAIEPAGTQKVFSKLVARNTTGPASGHGHGAFQNAHETTGGTELTQDNGASAWVSVSPGPFIDLQAGYDRSVQYDLNTLSFGVGLNVGYLIRQAKRPL
jgi:hypothetical protein